MIDYNFKGGIMFRLITWIRTEFYREISPNLPWWVKMLLIVLTLFAITLKLAS